MWLWDERLFDHDRGEFTPARLLADAERFGGFDAIVLWHAYPIIGLDDRNQFDFYRDVAGLGELVAEFHGRGVRVLVDYNPWDVGTRRRVVDRCRCARPARRRRSGPTECSSTRCARAVADAGHNAAPGQPRPVLEGESRVPLERIGDHEMSWAQWFADSDGARRDGGALVRAPSHAAPHAALEPRPQRRVAVGVDERDRVVVWDAVFGSWVGWNERDASTLRRMVRVQRSLADVLIDGEWTPLVDATAEALAAGVYVSRFSGPADDAVDDRQPWRTTTIDGPVLEIERASEGAVTWFDVTAGCRSTSARDELTVPARSVAGIVRDRR